MERGTVMVGLVLDQRTWNAVNVVGAAEPYISDYSSIYDQDTGISHLALDFPVEIDAGHTIRVDAQAVNPGAPMSVKLSGQFKDPDGDVLCSNSLRRTMGHNEAFILNLGTVVLDKSGMWTLYILLED